MKTSPQSNAGGHGPWKNLRAMPMGQGDAHYQVRYRQCTGPFREWDRQGSHRVHSCAVVTAPQQNTDRQEHQSPVQSHRPELHSPRACLAPLPPGLAWPPPSSS